MTIQRSRIARQRWFGRASGGQGLVEFTMAGLIFLMLLFAIMELALAILTYNTLAFAATQGARYGSTLTDSNQNATNGTPAVQSVVEGAAPDLSLTASNITVTWPADTIYGNGRNDVSVAVTYNYTFRIPGLASYTLPLTSTSELMCSQ